MQTALVFGGNGALGKAVVSAFAAKGWKTVSIDLAANADAAHNVILPKAATIEQTQAFVTAEVAKAGTKFQAVVNVAGGWAGGSVADEATAAATDLMIAQSVNSSIVAAHVASKYGDEKSLLVLPGAAGAVGPTPGMIGYGVAKAAVHHLVRSIAADASVLPKDASVVAVLPKTLDTPGNRAGMPDADFSSWTPTTDAALDIVQWSIGQERPKNGAFVVWDTNKGKTERVISE